MGLGVSGYFQVSQSVVLNPNSEPPSAEQVGKRSHSFILKDNFWLLPSSVILGRIPKGS